jgi:hypothetical protein
MRGLYGSRGDMRGYFIRCNSKVMAFYRGVIFKSSVSVCGIVIKNTET